jgi:hypothetical protein
VNANRRIGETLSGPALLAHWTYTAKKKDDFAVF